MPACTQTPCCTLIPSSNARTDRPSSLLYASSLQDEAAREEWLEEEGGRRYSQLPPPLTNSLRHHANFVFARTKNLSVAAPAATPISPSGRAFMLLKIARNVAMVRGQSPAAEIGGRGYQALTAYPSSLAKKPEKNSTAENQKCRSW